MLFTVAILKRYYIPVFTVLPPGVLPGQPARQTSCLVVLHMLYDDRITRVCYVNVKTCTFNLVNFKSSFLFRKSMMNKCFLL